MTPGEFMRMEDEKRIDIVAISRVVWGHKFLIIFATCIGGVIASLLAFKAIPSYRAEISISEVRRGEGAGAASLMGQIGGLANLVGVNLGSLSGSTGVNNQAFLKSRRLAEEFLLRNKLLPELSPKSGPPLTLWFAVRRFREGVVSILEDKRSGLIVVTVTWADPVIAAKWANDFVGLANELLRLQAISESKANIAYLNEQISKTNSVEMQRVMYGLIENETKTLMLANAKSEYAFSIIDPAVAPEQRFRPRRTLMVLLGLLLGGLVGTMAAFAHSRFRSREGASYTGMM